MENLFLEQNFRMHCPISCQMSMVTRPCVPYMTQVCISKVKVTGRGQMENLFLVQSSHILPQIFISQATIAIPHHNKMCVAYVGKVSISKVKVAVTTLLCSLCLYEVERYSYHPVASVCYGHFFLIMQCGVRCFSWHQQHF